MWLLHANLQSRIESGTSRTQSDICKVANVSEVTLRGYCEYSTACLLNLVKHQNSETLKLNKRKLVEYHGFQSQGEKTPKRRRRDKAETKKKSNAGELPCAIKGCEKFADKSLGGRSLSLDNALDMWGESNFTPQRAE